MSLPAHIYRTLLRYTRHPTVRKVPYTLPPYSLVIGDELNDCFFWPSSPPKKGTPYTFPPIRSENLSTVVRKIFLANRTTNKEDSLVQRQIGLGLDAIRNLEAFREGVVEVSWKKHVENLQRERNEVVIGDVVQHREWGWRGVVVGWEEDQYIDDINEDENYIKNDSDASTELGEKREIVYRILPDLADSLHLPLHPSSSPYSSPPTPLTTFPTLHCTMDELETSLPPYLKRVTPENLSYFFERFDGLQGRFVPNAEMRFLFPKDGNWEEGREGDDSEASTSLMDVDAVDVEAMSDRAAERIALGVKGVVASVLSELSDSNNNENVVIQEFIETFTEVQNFTSTQRTSDFGGSKELEVEDSRLRLKDEGYDGNSSPRSTQLSRTDFRIHDATTLIAKFTDAYKHLATLLRFNSTAQKARMDALEGIDVAQGSDSSFVKFPLGSLVFHTHFNFRGVVTGWDPKPRFDVRRWDGVQHIENVMEKVFYTVIPDENDAEEVFGLNSRHPRYVCEDNLILHRALEDGKFHKYAFQPNRELVEAGGVFYDSETDSYVGSDAVKFRHGVLDSAKEAEIISFGNRLKQCLLDMKGDVSDRSSASGTSNTVSDSQMLHLDNLFELLRLSNSKLEASAIEDLLREIWLLHPCQIVTEKFEDAASRMGRGDYLGAIPILQEIVEQDPEFVEAQFKLSTCHHLINTPQGIQKSRQIMTEEVLAREPRHIFGLLGISLQLMKAEEWEEARDYLRKLLELHPWCAASSNLMICELKMAEKENAYASKDEEKK